MCVDARLRAMAHLRGGGERWPCPTRRVSSVTFGGACPVRNGRGRREGRVRARRGRTRRSRCREPGGACVAVNGYPHSLCGRFVAGFHGSARPVGGRPGGGWREPADARGRLEQLLRSPLANGVNGSTVVGELALRRDSHPKPGCHQRRFRATRREAWVTGFDCGAGVLLDGRYATDPAALYSDLVERAGSRPLPCARTPQRDGKA